MSLIRGIRSMMQEYSRDFWRKSDQAENAVESFVLESSDDGDFAVILANDWPESITLNAKIFGIKNFDKFIFAESLKEQNSFGKNQIYATPNFHSVSEIKNKEMFCSKIQIKLDGEIDQEISEDFDVKFAQNSSDENVIFEKDFVQTTASFSEQYGAQKIPELHPYGGFFRPESFLEEIEQCWFQVLVESRKTALRIWRESKIPAKNLAQNSSKNTLKDDLFEGKCQIILCNKNTSESCVYKSDSTQKNSSSDCIKIHFIKQENPT